MKNRTRKQAKKRIFLIALIGLLAACADQATSSPVQLTKTMTVTPMELASPTIRPTIAPSTTAILLPQDAQALKDILDSPCIPVEPSLSENVETPWALLVMQERIVYVLNLEDGTMTEVEYFSGTTPEGYNKFIYDFFVSFDGKWLAYQDVSRKQLFVEPTGSILTNTDADRIRIDWAKSNRFWLRRWVDNDTVLVYHWKSQEDSFVTTVFLDPFTEQIHEFSLEELPNHKDYKSGGTALVTHYSTDGELSPDSTMTRIIYPEMYQDDTYNTLWDIESKSPLTRVEYIIDMYNNPLWLPDGRGVILKSVVKGLWQDMFLITETGTIKQITHFSEFVQEHKYYLSRQSRSNNGRFLAFRFSTYMQPNDFAEYFILDLSTDTLDGFCVSSSPPENSSEDSPIWSPDSKYLVISNIDRYNNGNIILVDIDNSAAYKISEDMEVIGWIAKP